MQLNIYHSNAVDNCTKKMFENILPNHVTEKYIVLTPDRRTLLTEQELFLSSNIKTFFNVNVTTFTRFTNEIISKNYNNNKKLLTKASAVAIIKKIMLENKNSLLAFKKSINYNGIAGKIFETISMFKSCKVNFQQISTETKNISLNNKLKDIKLIYEKYEEYLQNDYTDSFNKLNLLSFLVPQQDFSNTNFLLVGFDDFTPQIYDVISKLIITAKSVSVSCAASLNPKNGNNKNIFLNNIYLNLLDLSNIIGIKPNLIECSPNYNDDVLHFSKNIFAYIKEKKNLTNAGFFKLVKFDSKKNEVEFLSNLINYNVLVNGFNYKDFTVIAPNISDYENLINDSFVKRDIPLFLDKNQKFNEHVLVRFLLELFFVINENSRPENIVWLLKLNPLISQDEVFGFENLVSQSGLMGDILLEPLKKYSNFNVDDFSDVYNFLNEVKTLKTKLKNNLTVNEFLNLLQDFLKNVNFETINENLLTELISNNNVVSYKIAQQVNEKLTSTFSELTNLLGEYECSFSYFTDILTSYFENINLSLPPIEIDTVFVGDSVNSFIDHNKIIFVLGANSSVLPVALDDLGIISDDEINLLNNTYKLTPTINYINKRNKFLLYEKMLKAQKFLYISHLSVNEKNEQLMPSSVITDVLNMFNLPSNFVQNGEILLHKSGVFDELSDQSVPQIIFNNSNLQVATQNFISLIKDYYFYYNNANYNSHLSLIRNVLNNNNVNVEEIVGNLNYVFEYEKINNAYDLFFARRSTSVSQFESYFACPFKHFIEYGLKLKEELSSEIDARDYGVILHEFVAITLPFISENKDHLTVHELKEFSLKTITEILGKPDFEFINQNPKNANSLQSLKDESVRIANALLHEQVNSDFKPVQYEQRFDETNGVIKVESNNQSVSLKGVIDRIDVFNEKLRVIDYKTGSSSFNNFTEVVSGKKIQLLIYVKSATSSLNNICVGAFYLPLKNEYIKDDKPDELYKLKGIIANDLSSIYAMDKRLKQPKFKSDIINLRTKTNGEISSVGAKMVLEQDDINWLSEFSVKLIESAFRQVVSGNIEPYPLKLNKTDNYEQENLIGISNFNLKFGNKFRMFETQSNFNKTDFVFKLNVFDGSDRFEYDENLKYVKKPVNKS